MSDIIATRHFRTSKEGRVVARIYAPEPIAKTSEWSCKIGLSGLDASYEQVAIGVDSFQALYLGLRLLCTEIDKRAATLRFLDGDEGDLDTPFILTWSYGPALKEEVRRLINGKIKDALEAGPGRQE